MPSLSLDEETNMKSFNDFVLMRYGFKLYKDYVYEDDNLFIADSAGFRKVHGVEEVDGSKTFNVYVSDGGSGFFAAKVNTKDFCQEKKFLTSEEC